MKVSLNLLIATSLVASLPATSFADRTNSISEAEFAENQERLHVIIAELTVAGLLIRGSSIGDPAVQIRKAELELKKAEETPVKDHPDGVSVAEQKRKYVDDILFNDGSYKTYVGDAYNIVISDELKDEAKARVEHIKNSTGVTSSEKAKIIEARKLKLEQAIDLSSRYYGRTAIREGADLPESKYRLTKQEWLKTRGVILGSFATAGILVVDASRRAYNWYTLDESLQDIKALEENLKDESGE